jgi:exosome complex RNA-binding protein Rrp4
VIIVVIGAIVGVLLSRWQVAVAGKVSASAHS